MRSLVGTLMQMGACAPAILWVLHFPDARTALAAIRRSRSCKKQEWLEWLVTGLMTPQERYALLDDLDARGIFSDPARRRAQCRALSDEEIIRRMRDKNVSTHPTRREIADYLGARPHQLAYAEQARVWRMFSEFPELFS